MTLHHLDPRHDEPCPDCEGTGCDVDPASAVVYQDGCVRCNGSGKRGGEGGPEIATLRYDGSLADSLPPGWYWEVTLGKRAHTPTERVFAGTYGPFPTESDALFAARCELAGVEVEQHHIPGQPRDGKWCARIDGFLRGFHPTRSAALCAALDAQR